MRFSRATSNVELGRKRKRFKLLLRFRRASFYPTKTLGTIHRGLARAYYYQTSSSLQVSDAAALTPRYIAGAPVNSVTDYFGTTDWKAALRWYIPFAALFSIFFIYLVFSGGAPEAGKNFRSRYVSLITSHNDQTTFRD